MPSNDDGTVTPEELALELGVTGRTIRAYLRSKHGVLPPFVTRWHVDPERAADVRANVRSDRSLTPYIVESGATE